MQAGGNVVDEKFRHHGAKSAVWHARDLAIGYFLGTC